MKKILFVLLLLFTAVLSFNSASAQTRERVDLRPIKYLTTRYIDAIKDRNISVYTTFKCGSLYRKDWEIAYVKLTGKAFVWVDQFGYVHIHLLTADPPMMLDGFRPPQTLNTPAYDMDGNITSSDPEYWIRYAIWQTRPCVDFTLSLLSQEKFAKAWEYNLQGEPVHKYKELWEAMGLDRNTGLPALVFYSPITEASIQEIIKPLIDDSYSVQWIGKGYEVPSPDPNVIYDDGRNGVLYVLPIVAIVLLGVVVFFRVAVKQKEYA